MSPFLTRYSFSIWLLVLYTLSIDTAVLAQCDTSRWKASIDPGAGGAITDVLPASDVFQSGVLTVTPSATFPQPYFVSFMLKDTICITNNFSVEMRLKNDPASGGAVSGDTWFSLDGSGIKAGCLLEGDPGAQQYTGIYVGSSWMGNIPELVMDLSAWRTIRLDFIDNVVNWSYDGANFFSMAYTGSICNINNLVVGFRESGQVDYVKIFDASNTAVYYEEFNDCNNLATVPDCLPPMVTATSPSSTYCHGDSVVLTASANVSAQFSWTGPNGFTSDQQTVTLSNVSDSETGWYKVTGFVNPCTPVSHDSVYITIHPEKYTSVYPLICPGDYYFAAGSNQYNPGLYYDTLTASTGCDSIILTYLSWLSTTASTNPVSICSGDSILAGGQFQTVAGNYFDTLINNAGCDSVITTILSVIAPVYQNISHSICLGDSFFAGGNFQTIAGIYHDTVMAATGCDSIVITNLSVLAPVITTLTVMICEGDAYFAGGALQTQSGSYADTFDTSLGCDSIQITDLTVIAPVAGSRTVYICQNDSFYTGGNYQYQSGIYIDTLTSTAGCDSILTTDLQIIVPVYHNMDVFICAGDSLFAGGSFQNQTGYYNDTLVSNSGCDSIVITHLQLIVPVYTPITHQICEGESYYAGGAFQTAGGIYYDTLQSAAGCDSIIITTLEILQPVEIDVTVAICNGDSYFAGGALQSTPGTYIDTLQSSFGCDSIVTTLLQVLFPVYQNQSVSICDGESYFAGGSAQSLSGNYFDTLMAANGCDSIRITQLTVLPNPFVYLGQDTSICEGTSAIFEAGTGFQAYLWNDGSSGSSMEAHSTGTYWVQVTDDEGCKAVDSVLIQSVLQNPENFLPSDTAVCGAFSRIITVPGFVMYDWNNGMSGETVTFTMPGIYTLNVADAHGCQGTDVMIIESICEKAVLMPNAFTPNGDGLNDILKPVLLDDITGYELKIFNRWGKMIFHSSNPENGWDGRDSGDPATLEQYIWTVAYKNGSGQQQFEKGNVALLR